MSLLKRLHGASGTPANRKPIRSAQTEVPNALGLRNATTGDIGFVSRPLRLAFRLEELDEASTGSRLSDSTTFVEGLKLSED